MQEQQIEDKQYGMDAAIINNRRIEMKFTEYRSKALIALWVKTRNKYCCNNRNIVNHVDFSTREIDDICAWNWKHNNPIDFCANVLLDYITDIMGA